MSYYRCCAYIEIDGRGNLMAYIKGEFNDCDQDKMDEAFNFLVDLLGPKKLKPPKKNPESGKWHFYIKSPDHESGRD